MAINREELKKKAMKAASAEEVMEIVRAAGEEITAEEAEHIFKKAQEKKADKELSLDELDAVSGGEDRDWVLDGCAATVEYGSHCGSNDMCYKIDVTYDHEPTSYLCPNCGQHMYLHEREYTGNLGSGPIYRNWYRCKFCGCIQSEYQLKNR